MCTTGRLRGGLRGTEVFLNLTGMRDVRQQSQLFLALPMSYCRSVISIAETILQDILHRTISKVTQDKLRPMLNREPPAKEERVHTCALMSEGGDNLTRWDTLTFTGDDYFTRSGYASLSVLTKLNGPREPLAADF